MSLFALIVCAATSAFAAPTQLGHQGRLLDEDGIPLEGLHSLEFQIYDSIEDGTVLWSEVHDVELINGYYSLVLGADELDNPLEDSVFEEDELYLELTVDEDEELEPRQALNAVPYARIAGQATNLKGGVVDASEIRVGGSTVVDSSGTWVSSTPDVDWSELTGIPGDFADGEDANTQLSEAEVDAFTEDNGYAKVEDLEGGAVSISYDDLVDVPASIAEGAVGIRTEYLTESGSFTIPEGITSLIVYVTGGGGGGSNGETTVLDFGAHNHLVAAHSHAGGGNHAHSAGTHEHTGGSHTHTDRVCHPGSGYGSPSCNNETDTVIGGALQSGATSITLSEGSGTSGDAAIGTTAASELTVGDTDVSGLSITISGGSGGSGGGMNAVLDVSASTSCEITLGAGGDVAEAGGTTTITCGETSVTCTGGNAGATSGTFGLDGGCTTTGTPLNEYKASNSSPGGGGIGAQLSGAGAGQLGAVTIRY
jgi:hypothetical protein